MWWMPSSFMQRRLALPHARERVRLPGVCEQLQAEAVLESPQQAVVRVRPSSIDAGPHERTGHDGEHVLRAARRIGTLVPSDEQDGGRSECRRGLDLRHLACEEVVELTDGVAGAAWVVPVLAVVRDD